MGVLAIRGSKLDRAYMHELAEQLGVTDLLRRLLRDAGFEGEPGG